MKLIQKKGIYALIKNSEDNSEPSTTDVGEIKSYQNNPVYDLIHKKLDDSLENYYKFKKELKEKTERKFANKIGEWFLECKYNPQYAYCRKFIKDGYNEIYNANNDTDTDTDMTNDMDID